MTEQATPCVARLAVDIGGTFTDVVIDDGRRLISVKVPTTPDAPERGFLAGVRDVLGKSGLQPQAFASVIHGTTLATNALIERKGAKTALITTKGFRDSLEIGYESRYDQYDIHLEKPLPLAPRDLRFTVPERTDARGEVLVELDETAVHGLVPVLKGLGIESVAVGFLHAYANPDHERRVRDILEREWPGLWITLSSEVCPEIREYERLSTATANAYVQPAMGRYLLALELELRGMGFGCPLFMVTSAGDMTSFEAAIRFPIRLVESGPSGGASLAQAVAAQCEERKVLSYDMGGTTAKICLIEDYQAMMAREFEVARSARFMKGSGLPLRIPVVEMLEIGAGGGSTASVDALDRLCVGPDSAGAEPGPACYGKGGARATVTDADLALGRLDPERFAEGRLRLDMQAAEAAIAAHVGDRLDLPIEAAAHGIAEIVDENMANAARIHAVEHGKDLSEWTMVAFGGAGPLHAGRLAEKIGVRRLVIPLNPGVGSAVGFLWSPVAYEVVRSRYMALSNFDPPAVQGVFDELEALARAIVAPAAGESPLSVRRSALMRYVGQGHEVRTPVPDGPVTNATAKAIRTAYTQQYARLYGRALADSEIEILTWGLTMSTPRVPVEHAQRPATVQAAKPLRTGKVFDPVSESFVEAAVYWRADLNPGIRLSGPALVLEAQTTTVIPGSFTGSVDGNGNIILDFRKENRRNEH